MGGNRYRNATDFRKGLEARLQREAKDIGVDLQRVRRQVAFDRLLARLFADSNPPFFLKGGYAMELRLASARATRDIDLTYLKRLTAKEITLADMLLYDLQSLASMNLEDFFIYRVEPSRLSLDNAPYGGARFPVSSFIDGKLFVNFHLDVGGDTLASETEVLTTPDWLNFCGISPPFVKMISLEQQFAEKIHAYTIPRNHYNTRVKDMIDMYLLMQMRTLDRTQLLSVLHHVFRVRNTHPLPTKLQSPPSEWSTPYAALAKECHVSADIGLAFRAIQLLFWDVIGLR